MTNPGRILDGKTAVVAGALGRIGRSIADAFNTAGAETFGIDVAADNTGSTAFRLIEADVSRTGALETLVDEMAQQTAGIDIWVNAAYPRTENWGGPPERDTPEIWSRNVEMQMTATCLLSDLVARHMAERNAGSLINIASIYGMVAPDFGIYDGTGTAMPAPYAAIKAGLINHTRYLAAYYGPSGVRANVIAPGGVEAGQDQAFIEAYSKRTALKRMAKAEDVAGPALFLASDASAYVTGIVLPVDGGWTAI